MHIKSFLLSLTFATVLFWSISETQKSLVWAEPPKTDFANPIKGSSAVNSREPKIISRADWKAKAPVGAAKEHQIRFITIHHTATAQKENVSIEQKMQNLQNFSQREDRLASGKLKPVWFDVPYHFYIAVDGKIAEGRQIKFVGDTNTEYDPTGHALVVLEGNFETEQPAKNQQQALQETVVWLASKYQVPIAEIKAHNDFAATACPGKNLKILLPGLREKVGKIIKANGKPN